MQLQNDIKLKKKCYKWSLISYEPLNPTAFGCGGQTFSWGGGDWFKLHDREYSMRYTSGTACLLRSNSGIPHPVKKLLTSFTLNRLDTVVQSVLIRLYKVSWNGCTKCLDTAVQSVLIWLYKVPWYGCTKCLDTAVQSVLIRLYKVSWYGCTKCLDTAVQSALIRLYKESWYGYTKCLDTAVQSAHLVLNNHLELILKCFEIIFNYLAIDPVHMVPDLFYIYKEKRGGLDEGTILKYVSPCMQYMET